MHTEKVVVGDWSEDGHGHHKTFYISVPEDVDVHAALDAGQKKVGIELRRYCNRYEDSSIPNEMIFKIIENLEQVRHCLVFAGGPDAFSELEEAILEADLEPDGTFILTPDCYFALWLGLVNIGVAELYGGGFVYPNDIDFREVHDIGGYGLF